MAHRFAFIALLLLVSPITAQDLNSQDSCPKDCTRTVIYTITKTVSITLTSTASRCTKTITSTPSASTVTVTAPTSPPASTVTCAPTFKIQYQNIGYSGPTDYDHQSAIIAPDNEGKLVLSRVPTASNATVFTLDPEGLIFANYTSSSTGTITVIGNTVRADNPAGVLWTDQNEIFALTDRGSWNVRLVRAIHSYVALL